LKESFAFRIVLLGFPHGSTITDSILWGGLSRYQSGTARQATFLQEQDYEAFLKTLAEAHVLWGVEVFAYCLMSNHYHVCLRTPKGNLSRVMRHVDGLYTQRFNRSHGRDGSLFRGRYRAILIDADEYLAAVVRYIHLKPLRLSSSGESLGTDYRIRSASFIGGCPQPKADGRRKGLF
jgi:REP element-mobilizing transposase RayT